MIDAFGLVAGGPSTSNFKAPKSSILVHADRFIYGRQSSTNNLVSYFVKHFTKAHTASAASAP